MSKCIAGNKFSFSTNDGLERFQLLSKSARSLLQGFWAKVFPQELRLLRSHLGGKVKEKNWENEEEEKGLM